MSKKAKLITIISSVAVAVVLIVLTICLIVANNNREKTACSVVSITSGTSVHLVLNENDKVMDVVSIIDPAVVNIDPETGEKHIPQYALDDADKAKGIALSNLLEGKKYDEAVTLFVTKNVEAGYLDVDTEGYTIKIAINGTRKDYTKYQNNMKNSVNNYLSDMGIISGVKIENKSLADIVKELKSTAQNTKTLSAKELMSKYTTIVGLIENILPSKHSEFFASYDTYDTEYKNTLKDAQDTIDNRKQLIADLEEEIANLPDGDEKNKKLQEISIYNTNINSAQQAIDNAEQKLTNQVGEKVTTMSQNKDSDNKTLTTAYDANVKANANKLAEHKTTFENNKQATLDKIDNYRKTLEG